jgi:transposase InsO family protein
MPWKERSAVSLRLELVMLASAPGANVRRLCRRFGVSPKTAYKWIQRYQQNGGAGLHDRSRRPRTSPAQTSREIEQVVLRVRHRHPVWGGRKIRARLLLDGQTTVPSPSTITEILRRHGCLDPQESVKHQAWKRFEARVPNHLWQMDFKGHFPLRRGRCHPLTVLDDHSRFDLGLEACADEKASTVQHRLTKIFARYGLPDRILVDNGSPWGNAAEQPYTPLTAWLIRLGIVVLHSSPCHPQTLGKDERFHRTLKAELLRDQLYDDLDACQRRFNRWRQVYNHERPHESLGDQVPMSRYRESVRGFPKYLPSIVYDSADQVRTVQKGGIIHFRGRMYRVPRAFIGYPVALRATTAEDVFDVFFCHQKVKELNLRSGRPQR